MRKRHSWEVLRKCLERSRNKGRKKSTDQRRSKKSRIKRPKNLADNFSGAVVADMDFGASLCPMLRALCPVCRISPQRGSWGPVKYKARKNRRKKICADAHRSAKR